MRGIQLHLRRTALIVLLLMCVGLFFCTHLLLEISNLKDARVKLEMEVAQLQHTLGTSDISRSRRLYATNEQIRDIYSPYEEDMIILYNRVPKTGSTSFAGIAYDLCKRNKFHVLHVNITRNSHTLSLVDQIMPFDHKHLHTVHVHGVPKVVICGTSMFYDQRSINFVEVRFIQNITEWAGKKPAMYHGHFSYIDFSKFGYYRRPIYINIIRDPLDRMLSYYYFIRYGDDFRPNLKRKKAGDKESFDECVEKGGHDCDPENLWLQIPFFCGQSAGCRNSASRWALEEAKHNLVNNYFVVGITEELSDFIAILEATLPRFFRGATDLYNNGHHSHLRKTAVKITPKPETIAKIQESTVWKMENEFYEFAVEQFHFIKNQIFEIVDGSYVPKGKRFAYEKIRPR